MKSLSAFFLVLFLAGGIIFSNGSARADDSSASETDTAETDIPDGIPAGSEAVKLAEAQEIQYEKDGEKYDDTIKEYFTDGTFAYAKLAGDGTVIRSEIGNDGKPCFECFEVPDSSEVDDPPAPDQDDTPSGHSSGDPGLENGSSGAGNGGECAPGGS